MATFDTEVSHFHAASAWLKGGVEIEMSEKFSITVSGKKHQLKIMNATKDDSAEYTFVCGSDRSSATLTVNRKFLPSHTTTSRFQSETVTTTTHFLTD